MDKSIVWIKQPINKPDKKENPINFPDLIVKVVKYMLSGPGLIAKKILEIIKDNNTVYIERI